MKYFSLFILVFLCMVSCRQDPIPKPHAYLRLDYPQANYDQESLQGIPFTFEKNMLATKVMAKPIKSNTKSYGITLEYPSMKGTIYLTYKDVENDKDRLNSFLRDAQNFTQEHTKKADEILERVYENKEHKVYGMFYEVGGNAASQSQFYVTDSTNHFLTGSLYFYAKPNYDSILPAANYLKNDIAHIMESVRWK